jgi:hypothetical protein
LIQRNFLVPGLHTKGAGTNPREKAMDHPGQEIGPKFRVNVKSDKFFGDSRNLWFLALFGTFMMLTVLMIIFFRNSPNVELFFSPINLLLFALASYRLGRIVAIDEVTQPFRVFFIDTIKTQSGLEELPKKNGLRGAVATLITSPDSVGFWISGLLVYSFIIWPSVIRLFMIVLAINGLGELFNSLVHFLGTRAWQARQASEKLEREVISAEELNFPRQHPEQRKGKFLRS